MPATITCVRHPDVETRLSCSNCGDAICPRCAVPTPVGQKCPACAKQARGAVARGKPRQYVKAAGLGVLAAAAAAVALRYALRIPFAGWIVSGFAGYGVGRAVRLGSEGNASDPFRWMGITLGVLAVVGTFVLAFGTLVPGIFGIGAYAAAAYGAWIVFR